MSLPTMLFADRLVSAHPILAAFCEDFVARVTGRSRAPVDVPHLPGVSGIGFVRWLYRQWLAGGRRWGPLVHLDPARCPADAAVLADSAGQAAGGWLFVSEGWEAFPLVVPPDVRLLRQGSEVLDLPEAVGERIRWLDRFHLVTADPALESVRRTLLAHCRAGSALHLSGPVGSGRRSLVRWAHAALDDRRLVEVRSGEGRRPAPADWLLVDGALPLDDATAGWLRDRLTAATPPPAPPPVTSRGRRPVHPALAPIVGESPPLVAVLESVAKVAPTQLAVLVLGESGAGKESLARAIHEMSGRKGPYVIADLAAVNENLVESELFGHVRGAFSGADRDRVGAFRSADGGTLFLDELGNVPLRVQAKLLRALQERVVQPVGDDRSYKLDVRIVAATNADLEEMVQRGTFREDLLRRVEAVTLRLPPLRMRGADVLVLARSFLTRERGARAPRLSEAAERILLDHSWPGNIRELSNVMAHAAAFADDVVEPVHLGTLAAEEAEPARRLPDRLRALRVRLPGLAERGEASVRAAILASLQGRPIRSEALAFLAARPWPGQYHELTAELDAVCANVVGPVDLEGLRHAVPYLAAPSRKGGGEPRAPEPGTAAAGAPRAGAPGIPRLREEEVAAFCAVVLAHAGGSFAGHLEHALAGAAAPLDRVAAYVLGPRPTQYCVRLFAFPANGALREALRRRLNALPDVELRLARLPEGLQKLLQEPGPA
jgi:DNA-binding NtrC family response regulator